jgi:hypothetical protein
MRRKKEEEMKNVLENLNWNTVEAEYLEKTKQFVKALADGADVIYVREENGTGYYDLVVVEKEGAHNAVPLPVLLELFGFDKAGDIYDIMGIFERGFSNMTLDEYDEMKKVVRIREKTERFFREHDIVESLKSSSLILELTENQLGEPIATDELYLNSEGLFERKWLSCHSSSWYGFGQCACVNHPAMKAEVVTPEEALGLIREYVAKAASEEADKEKQLAKIDFILAELEKGA